MQIFITFFSLSFAAIALIVKSSGILFGILLWVFLMFILFFPRNGPTLFKSVPFQIASISGTPHYELIKSVECAFNTSICILNYVLSIFFLHNWSNPFKSVSFQIPPGTENLSFQWNSEPNLVFFFY